MNLTEKEILDELKRLGIKSDPEIASFFTEYQKYCTVQGKCNISLYKYLNEKQLVRLRHILKSFKAKSEIFRIVKVWKSTFCDII